MVIFRESAHVFALCNKIHLDKFSLVAVPTPHGRLIDADRLLESIKTNFYEHFGNYDSGQELLLDLICNSIEDFLTIIEAEVSE